MEIFSCFSKNISSYSASDICDKALKKPSKYLEFAKKIIEVKQGVAYANLILANKKQESKINSSLLKYERLLSKLNGVSSRVDEKKTMGKDNFGITNNLNGEKIKTNYINEKLLKHSLLLSDIDKLKRKNERNIIEGRNNIECDFIGERENKIVSGDKPVAYPRTVFYKGSHTKKIPVPTPRNLTERKNTVPTQEENVKIDSCMSYLQHQIVNNKVFISWNKRTVY
ncbi:hypothetical protein [Symbiopectobacterium purcellii]|uniref:hypothetical protein n=1 Tax=Symbiopectobacterium purcellii TaxID=2871826 RepID=UPI003F85C5AB